jgi:hypothetical protein
MFAGFGVGIMAGFALGFCAGVGFVDGDIDVFGFVLGVAGAAEPAVDALGVFAAGVDGEVGVVGAGVPVADGSLPPHAAAHAARINPA